MITFPPAATVTPGDPITSTQLVSLARAFNARLRSGLGDPTFRLFYLLLSLTRQIRNPSICPPDGSELWPPQAEFFESYQTFPLGSGNWPVTGAGDPEGANTTNLLAAFHLGTTAYCSTPPGPELPDEATRLSIVPLGPAETLSDQFALHAAQCGAYDPTTGALGAPAYTAARDYYDLIQSNLSLHGNAYGGFMPLPEYLGDCLPLVGEPPRPNYAITFTRLDNVGDPVTYPGTCPETEGHVAFVAASGESYRIYVWHWDTDLSTWTYTLDRTLDKREWLEGPYNYGGTLRHTWGDMLSRMLNALVKDFRGSDNQRAQPGYHLGEAFPIQEYFQRQNYLAPQYGVQVGESITAIYQTATLGPGPAGQLAGWGSGGSTYTYHAGFVLAVAYLRGEHLQAPCTLQFLDADTTFRTVTLTPDASGQAEALITFHPCRTPALSIRAASEIHPGATITIQPSEQLEHLPILPDLYLLLRLAAASADAGLDGHGTLFDQAVEAGQAYLQRGYLRNPAGELAPASHADGVLSNRAAFDAFRRLSTCVRVIPRAQFVGYEVTDGKSILYFKRLTPQGMDAWEAIAPSRSPVTTLETGRQYWVYTGQIRHGLSSLSSPQSFTATSTTFTPITPDTSVYEFEGIVPVAPPAGYTNQWLLDLTSIPYDPSESSIFKPEAYADYWPWLSRCHFAPSHAYSAATKWHFGGHPYVYAPEAASALTYWETPNDSAGENFYRSCRIYEPPAEIESVTTLVESGEEVVRVALTGRLHHCPGAPATILRDLAEWNTTALDAEPFRSRENALRHYLLHAYGPGLPDCPVLPGDATADSTIRAVSYPDLKGACYPRFFLTKLIPEPYHDPNDRPTTTDTRCTMDVMQTAELYLRAMCEGSVDDSTTSAYACLIPGSTGIIDYTFENLLRDAGGARWISPVGSKIRPDRPQGFGPLPNTDMLAETWNLYAQAINRLTRYRVILPFKIQCRTTERRTTLSAAIDWPTPTLSCSETGENFAIQFNCDPPSPGNDTLGSWTDCPEISVTCGAEIKDCDAGAYRLYSEGQATAYTYALVDPVAINAIPDTWRDMLDWDTLGFYGSLLDTGSVTHAHRTTDAAVAARCCSVAPCPGEPPTWWNGTEGYDFHDDPWTNARCQWFPAQDTLSSGAPPRTDLYFAAHNDGSWAICHHGSYRSQVITPIADALILTVPLE